MKKPSTSNTRHGRSALYVCFRGRGPRRRRGQAGGREGRRCRHRGVQKVQRLCRKCSRADEPDALAGQRGRGPRWASRTVENMKKAWGVGQRRTGAGRRRQCATLSRIEDIPDPPKEGRCTRKSRRARWHSAPDLVIVMRASHRTRTRHVSVSRAWTPTAALLVLLVLCATHQFCP